MTLENHAKVSKQISAQGSSTYCAKYVPFFQAFFEGIGVSCVCTQLNNDELVVCVQACQMVESWGKVDDASRLTAVATLHLMAEEGEPNDLL